ncbi:MAG: type II toxin-antitoxin system Phd/YefM family antitoxin [Candidatus Competibacterales bacterium]
MTVVNIHDAKTQLSRLIERVCAGEEVIIARRGQPMVRLVPVDPPVPKREFGTLRGQIHIDDRLFDPLPPDELEAWEN